MRGRWRPVPQRSTLQRCATSYRLTPNWIRTEKQPKSNNMPRCCPSPRLYAIDIFKEIPWLGDLDPHSSQIHQFFRYQAKNCRPLAPISGPYSCPNLGRSSTWQSARHAATELAVGDLFGRHHCRSRGFQRPAHIHMPDVPRRSIRLPADEPTLPVHDFLALDVPSDLAGKG